jgi:hypothetical protein
MDDNKLNDKVAPSGSPASNPTNSASEGVNSAIGSNDTIQESPTAPTQTPHSSTTPSAELPDMQTKPNTTPPSSEVKAPTQSMPELGDQPKKGNKSFFVVLAVVLLLTIIAVFLIVLNNNNSIKQPQTPIIPTIEPAVTVEPTSSLSPEEQEVESIDLENPAPTDLAPVEEDLEEL